MMMFTENPDATETKNVRILTVKNKMGIHARPAAMIVRVANKFSSTEILIQKDDEEVNGKSIMGIMMLAAGQGTQLTITASGIEAETLLDELEDLFERKFEEA